MGGVGWKRGWCGVEGVGGGVVSEGHGGVGKGAWVEE